MTRGQEELLTRLHQDVPQLTVRWDEHRRVVGLARAPQVFQAAGARRGEAAVQAFLSVYGDLFGPPRLWQRLRRLREVTDPGGATHIEYQQEHLLGAARRHAKGIEVYASKLVAHLDAAGGIAEIQSNCWRDIKVPARARVTAEGARRLLTKAAAEMPGSEDLGEALSQVAAPRLVIYATQGRFRLAWTTYAYAPVAQTDADGRPTGVSALEPGDVFIDATTGELFLFFPSGMHVVGSGRAVTPIGGPYAVRALEVEQVGGTATHRLRAVGTRQRAIVTYDDACKARPGYGWATRCDAIAAEIDVTLNASQNTTGPDWNTVAASASDADRTASQQPEVDAHFFCTQAYDWYAAIGDRVGWDNGAFSDTVEANLPVRVVVHVHNPKLQPTSTGASLCRSGWAQFWRAKVANRWRAFLLFCDGDPDVGGTTTRPLDFPAGSKSYVGHEYQHAITYLSFRDGAGNPGIGYKGWGAALHEGLSDAFGCMFASTWTFATEVSHDDPPSVIRNLAYPRDPLSWENLPSPPGMGHSNKDHFADKGLDPTTDSVGVYDHGTILGHAAFLMDAGGVHERTTRLPVMIPVRGLGTETVGAAVVSRAARIWYRALASYSATFGQITQTPADEIIFPGLADACRSAASYLYGAGSREHRTTELALYAVGLGVPGVAYGADLTFLRWAHEWRLSRQYLGGFHGTSPTWSSLDLFINNGAGAGWNAIVNVLDSSGNPTTFENQVYCRLRNVGDLAAGNAVVSFFYAKAGSGVGWQPVTDKNGVAQTLALASLAAGAMTFPEADQDNPPATAAVPWYIPPLAAGETVDHFCLKAVVVCATDVNPHNNEVQSNVVYVPYVPGSTQNVGFLIGNAGAAEMELDVVLEAETPAAWRVRIDGRRPVPLRPREERAMRVSISVPDDDGLTLPLDGEVRGELRGPLTGRCHGTVTSVRLEGERVRGRIGVDVEDVGDLRGTFDGVLDLRTAAVRGRVTGVFHGAGGLTRERMTVALAGVLRPWRRIDIVHRVAGIAVGGVTVQVQTPTPQASDWPPLAPTRTRVPV